MSDERKISDALKERTLEPECLHEELDRVYATDYDEGYTDIWKCCDCGREFNLSVIVGGKP